MLRSVQELEGYAVQATDGTIGHVKDFYVDDKTWVVRYLVVETGSWLSSRKVLISPISIGHPDWTERILPVSITKEQVKNSPDIDTDKPVSRQHEMQYLGYYGYPYYWGGAGLWGGGAYPGVMLTGVGYGKSGAEYLVAQADHTRAEADTDLRQKVTLTCAVAGCSCDITSRQRMVAWGR
jgi:sporulation protein YlmC with PRC-barrel domain